MTGAARCELVSFDLDGTLLDTAPLIAAAANASLAEHGIAARPLGEVRDLIGAGTRELVLGLLARCFLEQPSLAERVRPEAVLASMERHLTSASERPAPVYPGAREALESLRRAGIRLACVSNKETHHAARMLSAAKLEDRFDLLVGGDTLPHKKPHASVLRHVASRLGAEPRRCAHVGDSDVDVTAARNAGFAAWAVPYGYNRGMPIEASRPDRLFSDLLEMARHALGGDQSVPTPEAAA
jgi:phosphoglycolate phosphatase